MADDPNAAFPEPHWAPIQDVENVDLTDKRPDGGVDLLIVASQPLDDAADTLNRIRRKVAYYLDVIDLPEFQADIEFPPRDQTTIILTMDAAEPSPCVRTWCSAPIAAACRSMRPVPI